MTGLTRLACSLADSGWGWHGIGTKPRIWYLDGVHGNWLDVACLLVDLIQWISNHVGKMSADA